MGRLMRQLQLSEDFPAITPVVSSTNRRSSVQVAGLLFAAGGVLALVAYSMKDAVAGAAATVTDALLPATGGMEVTGYRNGQSFQMTVVSIGNGAYLRADAAEAMGRMFAAAAADGVKLGVASGWRSNEKQAELRAAYEYAQEQLKLGNDGPSKDGLHNFAMKPGYSTHQAGVSVDVSGMSQGGFNSPGYQWLKTNASAFGFKNDVSGAAAGEYWHWSFYG